MDSQDVVAAPLRAEWIARYAAHLMEAAPNLKPLDAVRCAMQACGDPTGEQRDALLASLSAESARLRSQ